MAIKSVVSETQTEKPFPKLMVSKYSEMVVLFEKKEHGQVLRGNDAYRIGHIGYVEMFDIIIAFAALEMALKDLGYDFIPGAGITAVQKAFMENNYLDK